MTKQMNSDATAVLQQVKQWFEQALQSNVYAAWQQEAQLAWDFYDGNQWTAEEVNRLAENGQPAIVINKLAAKIDSLAGTEVQGRTRIVYRSRSGQVDEERTARLMSELALYVAERSDQALEISKVFRAGLVSGVGWLDVGVQPAEEGVQIVARAEDEGSVVWDPLCRRLDMSDARFVARERWLEKDALHQLFPEQAERVMQLVSQGELLGGGQGYVNLRPNRVQAVGYYAAEQELFRVVEVQFWRLSRQWRVRLANGTSVTTFERQELPQLGGTVEEVRQVPRVFVAVFAGETLLEYRPLNLLHNRFTLIPFVYKRQRNDGRPYGLVRAALDPQRELNKRRSKAMHLLNTAQVIADVDAVEDPTTLAREAARPDGVILKRAGKDLRIIRNADLASSQVSVMEQAGRDIQEVLGVFDESIGKESNATSGVAIQQRQRAGSLNQMFAYDALRLLKKQLGEQVLALVRQFFTPEMVLAITDRLAASRELGLPTPNDQALRTVQNGLMATTLLPNLAQAALDVVVEEVADAQSGRELEAQKLQLLLQAGVPVPPEVLVEALGVRDKDRILAALRQPEVNQGKQ